MANPTKEATFRFHITTNILNTSTQNPTTTTTTTTKATKIIEHTHPVPLFLCDPDPSHQRPSSDFQTAYIDLITVITSLHHDECMAQLASSHCAGGLCHDGQAAQGEGGGRTTAKKAGDCLKSPINFLHLTSGPLVIIQIQPVCSINIPIPTNPTSKSHNQNQQHKIKQSPCATHLHHQMLTSQTHIIATAQQAERDIFIKMPCKVCGKPEGKRCRGCGQVAYCGVECQRVDWKVHRKVFWCKNGKGKGEKGVGSADADAGTNKQRGKKEVEEGLPFEVI